MRIGTFDRLLKGKHGQGTSAYVPERRGKRRQAIAVSYSSSGKCYYYSGSILSVAERLDLIPEIDVQAESKRIARELKDTGKAEGHRVCIDTVVFHLDVPVGKVVDCDDNGVDEFDRPMATFFIASNDWV